MNKMRVLIFLVAIATAVADFPHSPPVPTVLEGATPVEVLLYLYDVVLTSQMTKDINNSGGVFYATCLNSTNKLASGKCSDEAVTVQPDYLDLLY